MQLKAICFCIILVVSVGRYELRSQTMFVREISGTQTSFALSSIRKLTFFSGNMIVSQAGINSDTFSISQIRYINFTDLTPDFSNHYIDETESFTLYPNPVSDELLINYSLSKHKTFDVDIISIDGKKLIFKKILNAQFADGKIIINISSLPQGLYLCYIKNDETAKVYKFIKN